MGIKPMVSVIEGKVSVVGKIRGAFLFAKNNLQKLIVFLVL